MRAFLLILIGGWLGGIIVGSETRGWVVVVVAGGVAAWLWYQRFRLFFITAIVAVFLLGAVVALGSTFSPPCFLETIVRPVMVEITERTRVSPGSAHYEVVSVEERACSFVITTTRFPLYQAGMILLVDGTVQAVQDLPAESEGYAQYLTRRGISGLIRYPTVTVISGDSSWRYFFYDFIRERIVRTFQEPEASFVLALVLGEQGSLPQDFQEHFRRTGLTHVLVVSGSHISLLAGVIALLVWPLPLPLWVRSLIVLTAAWMYIFLIGLPASAVRAGWFWTFFLWLRSRFLLGSLPTALIGTSVVMLSFDPRSLNDLGFLLSIAAVAGIWLMLFVTQPWRNVVSWRQGILATLVLSSVGAHLATWPLIAYTFGTLTGIGLLANVIIVPLVPAVTIVALISTIVGGQWTLLALTGDGLVRLIFSLMDRVTTIASHLPGAFFENVYITKWVAVGYYVAMALLIHLILKRSGRRWREVWG